MFKKLNKIVRSRPDEPWGEAKQKYETEVSKPKKTKEGKEL